MFHKHFLFQFDEASAGVEVVIADGVETIIEDENIQQFVHTETISQSSASICKVGVTGHTVIIPVQ